MKLYTKINSSAYPEALPAESRGLAILRDALTEGGITEIRIPRVHRVTPERLEIEAIKSAPGNNRLFFQLGTGLAKLHLQVFPDYGLAENNFIGLNPQHNGQFSNWGNFFLKQRLDFQITLIRDSQVRELFTSKLGPCRNRVEEFLTRHCEHPSLVHGDLWAGNVLFDDKHCWLIDPAVYYGDRETDLAMSELFGGFDREFYEAYDAVYPRSKEYPVKKRIYNLYHCLNHYNLFGVSYLPACQDGFDLIAQRFT